MLSKLTDAQLEARLDVLEAMIAGADVKDLPAFNRVFQLLLDEQVRRDLLPHPGAGADDADVVLAPV